MKLTEKQIAALEAVGFNRWTKGTMDRLYINAETLGLELDYYKSGNISGASYRGETISHKRGGEMKAAKTYIDVATGELHGTNWTLEQDTRQLYEETLEALEAAETTETTENEEEETMKQNVINNTEWTEIEAVIDGEEIPALLIHDLTDVNRDGDMIVANGCEIPENEEEADAILTNETGLTAFRIEDGKYYIDGEEAPANRDYEIKAKIVRAGASRVFNSWHENSGISMEDFLEGLRWLCDDPMTDGHPTRELGCIRKADTGYTPEQLAILGEVEDGENVGLHRLTRSYHRDGSFAGFYDEDGLVWGKGSDRASINRLDRV